MQRYFIGLAGLAAALFLPGFTAAAFTGEHSGKAEFPTRNAAISKNSGRNLQCNRSRISGRAGWEACTEKRPRAARLKGTDIPKTFNMQPPEGAPRRVKIEQSSRSVIGIRNSRAAPGSMEEKQLAAESPSAGNSPQFVVSPTRLIGCWYNLVGALVRCSARLPTADLAKFQIVPNHDLPNPRI